MAAEYVSEAKEHGSEAPVFLHAAKEFPCAAKEDGSEPEEYAKTAAGCGGCHVGPLHGQPGHLARP